MHAHHQPTAVRRIIALAMAAVLLLTLAAFASPSSPAGAGVPNPPGSISGVVTDDNGEGIPGLTITATGSYETGTATTDSEGAYTVHDLPADDYIVHFGEPEESWFIPAYWVATTDLDDATPVPLASGEAVTGISIELELGGRIAGQVTGDLPADGPVADVTVRAELVGCSCDPWVTTTDITGSYRFYALPEGSYTAAFDPSTTGTGTPWLAQWFDGASEEDDAEQIYVYADTEDDTVDAHLVLGGSFGGTVTDDETGLPLPGVTVTASDDWTRTTTTDGAGNYVFEELLPGEYHVSFEPAPESGFLSQWYDGVPDFEDATTVTVSGCCSTPDIDAALTTPAGTGWITGSVTDVLTGLPVEGIEVTAADTDFGAATTDSNGDYVIGGLAPGNYLVTFDDCACIYDWQFYDNTKDFDDATQVAVTADTVTGSIDAELSPFATIGGLVTEKSTGLPIEGADVSIVNTNECECPSYGTYTDEDGNYFVDEVPAGTYKVFIGAPTGLASQWYDQKYSEATATLITLAPGQVDTDNNLQLVPPVGTLKGKVIDGDGIAIGDARAHFYNAAGVAVGSVSTSRFGNYTKSMPSGEYKIQFTATGFLPEWNGGASSFATAPLLTLDPGTTVTENTSLAASATFYGLVSNANTMAPVLGSKVSLFDPLTGVLMASDTTNPSGAYQVTGLPAGQYKVQYKGAPNYYTQWAGGGGQTKATATPITLPPGTSGLNVYLVPVP